LQVYAVYSFLRDVFGTYDFRRWGIRATVTEAQIHTLADPSQLHHDGVLFYYFVQFACFVQLRDVARAAARHGIVLQIELPVSMPSWSADVWAHNDKHLFVRDRVIGLPPDRTYADGQRLFYAPYNWEGMANDGYNWWRQRFRYLRTFFGSVRLCQVSEYFRTFCLEEDSVIALSGVFLPNDGFSVADLEVAGITTQALARITKVLWYKGSQWRRPVLWALL
jgi:4-alpha-glucanotransferase